MWSIVILPALVALISDIQQNIYTFQDKLNEFQLPWVRESYVKANGFYRNNRLYNVFKNFQYPQCARVCKNKVAKLWRLKKEDDLEYLFTKVLDIHSEAAGIWVYTRYLDGKTENGSINIIGDGFIVDEDQIAIPNHSDAGDSIDKVPPYPMNKCTAITRLSKRKFRGYFKTIFSGFSIYLSPSKKTSECKPCRCDSDAIKRHLMKTHNTLRLSFSMYNKY